MILRVIIPVPVVDGDFSHELTCIEKSMHYYDCLCEKNSTRETDVLFTVFISKNTLNFRCFEICEM